MGKCLVRHRLVGGKFPIYLPQSGLAEAYPSFYARHKTLFMQGIKILLRQFSRVEMANPVQSQAEKKN